MPPSKATPPKAPAAEAPATPLVSPASASTAGAGAGDQIDIEGLKVAIPADAAALMAEANLSNPMVHLVIAGAAAAVALSMLLSELLGYPDHGLLDMFASCDEGALLRQILAALNLFLVLVLLSKWDPDNTARQKINVIVDALPNTIAGLKAKVMAKIEAAKAGKGEEGERLHDGKKSDDAEDDGDESDSSGSGIDDEDEEAGKKPPVSPRSAKLQERGKTKAADPKKLPPPAKLPAPGKTPPAKSPPAKGKK